MTDSRFDHPNADRSRLRAIVTTMERELSYLPRLIATDDGETPTDRLLASFADLVELLSLGPKPAVRECPVCKHIGMRTATRCGYCWTNLSPSEERDGVVR